MTVANWPRTAQSVSAAEMRKAQRGLRYWISSSPVALCFVWGWLAALYTSGETTTSTPKKTLRPAYLSASSVSCAMIVQNNDPNIVMLVAQLLAKFPLTFSHKLCEVIVIFSQVKVTYSYYKDSRHKCERNEDVC